MVIVSNRELHLHLTVQCKQEMVRYWQVSILLFRYQGMFNNNHAIPVANWFILKY